MSAVNSSGRSLNIISFLKHNVIWQDSFDKCILCLNFRVLAFPWAFLGKKKKKKKERKKKKGSHYTIMLRIVAPWLSFGIMEKAEYMYTAISGKNMCCVCVHMPTFWKPFA